MNNFDTSFAIEQIDNNKRYINRFVQVSLDGAEWVGQLVEGEDAFDKLEEMLYTLQEVEPKAGFNWKDKFLETGWTIFTYHFLEDVKAIYQGAEHKENGWACYHFVVKEMGE